MKQVSLVEFTHANTGGKVLLNPVTVYLVYESRDKSTHVTSNAGSLCPVKESVDQVKREIEQALNGEK